MSRVFHPEQRSVPYERACYWRIDQQRLQSCSTIARNHSFGHTRRS